MAQLNELRKKVFAKLAGRGATLAVAESCTGGKLGAALVDLPGISEVFCGGVIAYDNKVKTKLLGVPEKLLQENGAVSREVALKMAEGARQNLGSDYAVSVTGIAGPTGGTEKKPVGTVEFAVVGPGLAKTLGTRFDGDRISIQNQAVEAALQLVLQAIDG